MGESFRSLPSSALRRYVIYQLVEQSVEGKPPRYVLQTIPVEIDVTLYVSPFFHELEKHSPQIQEKYRRKFSNLCNQNLCVIRSGKIEISNAFIILLEDLKKQLTPV